MEDDVKTGSGEHKYGYVRTLRFTPGWNVVTDEFVIDQIYAPRVFCHFRVFLGQSCWGMSLPTSSSHEGSSTVSWARRCSLEITQWLDGEGILIDICGFFLYILYNTYITVYMLGRLKPTFREQYVSESDQITLANVFYEICAFRHICSRKWFQNAILFILNFYTFHSFIF